MFLVLTAVAPPGLVHVLTLQVVAHVSFSIPVDVALELFKRSQLSMYDCDTSESDELLAGENYYQDNYINSTF